MSEARSALFVLPQHAVGGNRVTALRWARILRRMGLRVARDPSRATPTPDLLVALHGRKTGRRVNELRLAHPGAPVIVAVTGTDLYVDLDGDQRDETLEAFAAADRLIVLQSLAKQSLPEELRAKTVVMHQSAPKLPAAERKGNGLMLAGVRPVKDPLTVVRALMRLPETSSIAVDHFGAAIDTELAGLLRATTPRYQWLGRLPRQAALERLTRAPFLICPSQEEGGANVVTEAAVQGTPVLASRCEGNLGLLGDDHPGLFDVGDERQLAALLARFESDPALRVELHDRSEKLGELADPGLERAAWEELLLSLGFES